MGRVDFLDRRRVQGCVRIDIFEGFIEEDGQLVVALNVCITAEDRRRDLGDVFGTNEAVRLEERGELVDGFTR